MSACRFILFLFFIFRWINCEGNGKLEITVEIENITITGNYRTKESVIKRELHFKQHDIVGEYKLEQLVTDSKQALENLSLFNKVEITVNNNLTNPQKISINVQVEERWYLWAEPKFSIADRNFNSWLEDKELYRTTYGLRLKENNLFGLNQKLNVDVIFGWSQSIVLRYRVPYFNKSKTIGFETQFSHTQGHEMVSNTINNKNIYFRNDTLLLYSKDNIYLKFSYRPKVKSTFTTQFKTERFKIADTVSQLNTHFLYAEKNLNNFNSVTFSYVYESRDYYYYPTKGNYIMFNLGSLVIDDFLKTIHTLEADIIHFTPISQKFVIGNNLRAKWSSGNDLPYYLLNSLGYRQLVRGNEHYVFNGKGWLLTNNDFKFKVLDKSIYLKFLKLNQLNKIPAQVWLKLVSDAGIILTQNPTTKQLLWGIGPGLDFLTYYENIMRLEYTFNSFGESELFLHYLVAF